MSIRTKLNPIGGLLLKEPFMFTITPDENNQYTINFSTSSFINPIKVYWGDGTYESVNDISSITHTYPNQNDYSIEIHSITGKMPKISFRGDTQLKQVNTSLLKCYDDKINITTMFSQLFFSCISLQSIPENLFINNINVSDFDMCFLRCSNVTSSVPELWVTHPNATHSQCFNGCTQASNYDDIPEDWK